MCTILNNQVFWNMSLIVGIYGGRYECFRQNRAITKCNGKAENVIRQQSFCLEILLDLYKSAVVFAPTGNPHKIPNKNAEAPKGVREKTECQNFLKDTRSGSSRPE